MVSRAPGLLMLVCLLGGWGIPQPAGWTDDTSQIQANLDRDEKVKATKSLGGRIEARGYVSPSGEMLRVVLFVVGSPGGKQAVDEWLTQARTHTNQLGKEVAYRRTDSALAADVRHSVQADDRVIYTRSLSGLDPELRVHSVTAYCTGTAITCTPLLQELSLDTMDLVELATATATGAAKGNSAAYRYGRIAGQIFLVAVFGIWIWSRRRRT
jgi:hypothetical protein